MTRGCKAAALALAQAWCCAGHCQTASLDFAFRPSFDGTVYAITIQPDSKILVGGYFTQVNGESRPYMVRLFADGRLDPTFSVVADDVVFSIVMTPEQEIYVRGYFTSLNGVPRLGLARLNIDGSVDPSFAPTEYHGTPSLALQADGKLLVATSKRLYRLNRDGSQDLTFQTSVGGYPDEIQCVAIAPDRKIVLGGYFNSVNGLQEYRRVAKLSTNGNPLINFQTYRESIGPGVVALLPDPDGSVVVGGASFMRLLPSGRTDTNFLQWGSNIQAVFALCAQPGNKVLAGGGFNTLYGYPANFLLRVNWNGSIDASFKHSGPDDQVWTITPQLDGKILIAGAFQTYDGVPQPFIARLLGDQPTLDHRPISGGLELSWPAAYTNFVLQSAGAVASNWIDVPVQPVTVSNMCYVTNILSSGNQFFRMGTR